jgi:hypothetical protein
VIAPVNKLKMKSVREEQEMKAIFIGYLVVRKSGRKRNKCAWRNESKMDLKT